MSWENFDLSAVSTEIKVMPEGQNFNFELLPGAKENPWKAGRIDAGAKVIDGEFAGEVIWFSYPDPTEQPWVPGVFARMIKALGVAAEQGEGPVAYLGRAAGNKFTAPIKLRNVDQDGVETKKAEIKIGNVKPYRS